jgi:hypothetical protein
MRLSAEFLIHEGHGERGCNSGPFGLQLHLPCATPLRGGPTAQSPTEIEWIHARFLDAPGDFFGVMERGPLAERSNWQLRKPRPSSTHSRSRLSKAFTHGRPLIRLPQRADWRHGINACVHRFVNTGNPSVVRSFYEDKWSDTAGLSLLSATSIRAGEALTTKSEPEKMRVRPVDHTSRPDGSPTAAPSRRAGFLKQRRAWRFPDQARRILPAHGNRMVE